MYITAASQCLLWALNFFRALTAETAFFSHGYSSVSSLVSTALYIYKHLLALNFLLSPFLALQNTPLTYPAHFIDDFYDRNVFLIAVASGTAVLAEREATTGK